MPIQSANPPELIVLDQFAGQNSQAARSAIDDQELAWCENFIPVGSGNLRSVMGPSAAVYTASGGLTIISAFAYYRGGRKAMVFLSDGSAVELNLDLGGSAAAFGAGTFTITAGKTPRLASWGISGIVIVNPQTNGFWAWDGSAYASGSASPAWLNGGTPTTMPSGVSGTAVTIFQSRVVIMNGAQWLMSAPNNGAQFATSSGGVLSTSSDPFLAISYTDAAQTSGFLYLFGDSSIAVVSNVQTSGSPSTTTFNYANVDPQVGQNSVFPVLPFGRAIMHVNAAGVYALYGGAAEKVSDKMNNLFAAAAGPFSMALAILNGVKMVLCRVQGVDYAGTSRALICGWDGKKWCILSQGLALLQIFTSEVDSDPVCYGCTATAVYKLFGSPTTTLTKVLQSKLYPGRNPIAIKQVHRFYSDIADLSGAGVSLACTMQSDRGSQALALSASTNVTITDNLGNTVIVTNNSSQTVVITAQGEQLSGTTVQLAGLLLGWLVTSISQSFAIQRFILSYEDRTLFGA